MSKTRPPLFRLGVKTLGPLIAQRQTLGGFNRTVPSTRVSRSSSDELFGHFFFVVVNLAPALMPVFDLVWKLEEAVHFRLPVDVRVAVSHI